MLPERRTREYADGSMVAYRRRQHSPPLPRRLPWKRPPAGENKVQDEITGPTSEMRCTSLAATLSTNLCVLASSGRPLGWGGCLPLAVHWDHVHCFLQGCFALSADCERTKQRREIRPACSRDVLLLCVPFNVFALVLRGMRTDARELATRR